MPKPNILLILADDMGYGDFAIFNEGLSRTPSLDQLARESICLTQHYAASCVCAPSRASLLTGRYPHRTGAIDTLDGRGLDRLALREITLADVLKAHGYATGLVGKWHLGAFDPRYHPNARGFDEFVGFRGGWSDYYKWRIFYNNTVREADGRYLTDVFTEEAISFIRRHRDEPFLIHLAYNAPHTPLQAPEEDVARFEETGQFNKGVSILYGMIQRMDRGIGQILEELDDLGLRNRTIVMFTSDNGPQFGGQDEMCTTRFNCGFNGAKGSVYEGGIRVPMLIRWPEGLPEPRAIDDMVHFVDWFPTLLAAAGLQPPRDRIIDGHNVLPLLRGEPCDVPTRRFWQWNRYQPVITCNAAMRDGDWKLVRPAIREAMIVAERDLRMDVELRYEPGKHTDVARWPEPERQIPEPPPAELYNIAADPLEKNNLAEVEPDRARRMLRELETWFEEVEAERRTIDDKW
ncbi:MAG: arylsulfatase [Armatimonadetes bacterium]|nr:arylsulfatase [Armatimonadota bacterium]